MSVTPNETKFIKGGVCAPKGFLANGIHCGIRRNKTKMDLSLIISETVCEAAAVYTQNPVCGAPVTVTKESLADGKAQAVICNSGIANTCNAGGLEKAREMRKIAAAALGIAEADVIVASTGVIGQPLNLEPIAGSMEKLAAGLNDLGSDYAAQGIMTTDTRKKEYAVEFVLGGKVCRIGAIAKGSGMINPNMATMLCFITSDAAISAAMLGEALKAAAADSFNMLSVDGDTSTNDMVSVMANGMAGNEPVTAEGEAFEQFKTALTALCVRTAREMARDGEGATKLIECAVTGAAEKQAARKMAKSVINSLLVKTAMFGADANWGRVICAMGYSGASFNPSAVAISFRSDKGSIEVCSNGTAVDFDEEKVAEILLEDEIAIDIRLTDGDGFATAFGCDLSYEYVKINGDYRT